MLGNSGGKTNTSCLADPSDSRQTISLQMCGNGIVEEGEECDPGSGVTSPCCDASTCKLKAGASCDPQSSSCCTDQCSFAPTTQVCRPSKDGACDTAEFCTGNSSSCPTDTFSPNGGFLIHWTSNSSIDIGYLKVKAAVPMAWPVRMACAHRWIVSLHSSLVSMVLIETIQNNAKPSVLRWV